MWGHLGPVWRAGAMDLAIAYSIIAGPDPKDLLSVHQPPVSLRGISQSGPWRSNPWSISTPGLSMPLPRYQRPVKACLKRLKAWVRGCRR